VHEKANYTEKDPALRARIDAVNLFPNDPKAKPTPRITFGDEVEGVTAEDLFLAHADRDRAISRTRARQNKVNACARAIYDRWVQLGKPRRRPEADFANTVEQFSPPTRSRARTSLGVEAAQDRNLLGRVEGWEWIFPETMKEPS
jgi:hypothetical protein